MLHKLQGCGGSSFFCLIENYPFLKTEQWHNCLLCASSRTEPHISKTSGAQHLTQSFQFWVGGGLWTGPQRLLRSCLLSRAVGLLTVSSANVVDSVGLLLETRIFSGKKSAQLSTYCQMPLTNLVLKRKEKEKKKKCAVLFCRRHEIPGGPSSLQWEMCGRNDPRPR